MGGAANVSRHTYRTPANMVTLVRILLTPVLMVAIYEVGASWWVFLFGFAVTFTDRIDGILARRYGTSNVGTFLDPLSDKFLVLGTFATLAVLGWIAWLPVGLIALREVIMSVWRSHFAQQGKTIPARQSGKYKMWVQSATVGLALAPGVVSDLPWLLTIAVWLSVAITYVSLGQYFLDARRTGDPVARDVHGRSDHSASPRP